MVLRGKTSTFFQGDTNDYISAVAETKRAWSEVPCGGSEILQCFQDFILYEQSKSMGKEIESWVLCVSTSVSERPSWICVT